MIQQNNVPQVLKIFGQQHAHFKSLFVRKALWSPRDEKVYGLGFRARRWARIR